MATLTPWFFPRMTDENGKPLSRGLVYTYSAGTSTAKSTYTDSTGLITNTNPIQLNAGGINHIWLGDGTYKIIVTDGSGASIYDPATVEGNVIWQEDVINGVGTGDSTVQTVATIAALKASTTLSGIAVVKGYYAALDNGGGTFYYDTANGSADNGGTVIIPNSAPTLGRWMRLFSGPIDIRWFGAKGDGTNDDAAKVTAADTYAYGYSKNTIAYAGTYKIASDPVLTVPMELKTNAVLKMVGTTMAITPIIDMADETRHFNFDSGNPTFPATANIKNIWLDGTSTGWLQYHLPTNDINSIIIINDNAGTWTAGSITATVNGTVYTQASSTVKNTDLTALAAQIQAHGSVLTAVYTAADHAIVITPESGRSVDVVTSTTGITGGMTFSVEKRATAAISTTKRILSKQGADVASANDLVLGNDGNAFVITGATQVNRLSSTGWPLGSVVTLVFDSVCVVKHNKTAGGEFYPIFFPTGLDYTTSAGSVLTLVFNAIADSCWRVIAIRENGDFVSKNVSILTAGYGLKIKEGSNARMGVATFAGIGTIAVTNSSVTANTRILLSPNLATGLPFYVSAQTGTAPWASTAGFTIASTSAPTGSVNWLLIEPA